MSSYLLALQENQLVTFEIEKPLYNRIEKNRKESKVKEKKGSKDKKPITKITDFTENKNAEDSTAIAVPVVEKFNAVKFYCDAWRIVYKSEESPIIDKKIAGQLHTVLKNVGEKKFKILVENYFKMSDQWFITKRHDVSTFVSNLNAIVLFSQNGVQVTRKDLKKIEEKTNDQKLLQSLETMFKE
jgi:hypothetical protein